MKSAQVREAEQPQTALAADWRELDAKGREGQAAHLLRPQSGGRVIDPVVPQEHPVRVLPLEESCRAPRENSSGPSMMMLILC